MNAGGSASLITPTPSKQNRKQLPEIPQHQQSFVSFDSLSQASPVDDLTFLKELPEKDSPEPQQRALSPGIGRSSTRRKPPPDLEPDNPFLFNGRHEKHDLDLSDIIDTIEEELGQMMAKKDHSRPLVSPHPLSEATSPLVVSRDQSGQSSSPTKTKVLPSLDPGVNGTPRTLRNSATLSPYLPSPSLSLLGPLPDQQAQVSPRRELFSAKRESLSPLPAADLSEIAEGRTQADFGPTPVDVFPTHSNPVSYDADLTLGYVSNTPYPTDSADVSLYGHGSLNGSLLQHLQGLYNGARIAPMRSVETESSCEPFSDLQAFLPIRSNHSGSTGSHTAMSAFTAPRPLTGDLEPTSEYSSGIFGEDPKYSSGSVLATTTSVVLEGEDAHSLSALNTSKFTPRSPIRQLSTFASGDSSINRTLSTSALINKTHTRMLSTSSIFSSGSNKHVNLATLKRTFSLRPGEGERSSYVQLIRKNAGTALNETGPGKWKLPTGITPQDVKNKYLLTSTRFNRRGNAITSRGKKTSGVELKHGHLQPRLLASEVDEVGDSNRFGSLGRSSTFQNRIITPVTSSTPSANVSALSRQSSIGRASTITSRSTVYDAQSVGTTAKSSRRGSAAYSVASVGSISDYRADGYYQHPGYKFDDDEPELLTDEYTPTTNDATLDYDYDDDKPRLVLANPDSSSDNESAFSP